MATTPSTALDRLVGLDNADLLATFLAALAPKEASRVSSVCLAWASAAELGLHAKCTQHGWKQPRRARLQALQLGLPWRALFVARSCRACMTQPGDFAVRNVHGNAPRCFLCARCAKSARVVTLLQQERATLDVTGLSGKPLYSKRESKFCAEAHQLSKESLDGASGARAELLRHSAASRGRR